MMASPEDDRRPVRIVDVNAAGDGELSARIYRELLEPTFPPDELDPFDLARA